MKTLLIGNTFSGSCYTTGNVVVEINELNVLFGLKKDRIVGRGSKSVFGENPFTTYLTLQSQNDIK